MLTGLLVPPSGEIYFSPPQNWIRSGVRFTCLVAFRFVWRWSPSQVRPATTLSGLLREAAEVEVIYGFDIGCNYWP